MATRVLSSLLLIRRGEAFFYDIKIWYYYKIENEDVHMLDFKRLRANFEEVKTKLATRGEDISGLDRFEELDERRRAIIAEAEELKSKRNEVSQEVSQLKRDKKDADHLLQK